MMMMMMMMIETQAPRRHVAAGISCISAEAWSSEQQQALLATQLSPHFGNLVGLIPMPSVHPHCCENIYMWYRGA